MKDLRKIIMFTLLSTSLVLSGCAYNGKMETATSADEELQEETEETLTEENKIEQTELIVQPVKKTVSYFKVLSDGVNIRSSATTSSSVVGTAEKGTLYALTGESGSWFKTFYKGKTAYIYNRYCERVEMAESDDSSVEKIIAEGCKYMGVKYVYGAVRYHDGSGRLLSGFSSSAFDCSSLMQYIFKVGANKNIQVNTRTQVLQGSPVKRSELRRGDLMFFTNASRLNKTGVEHIGHVALYLGDNLILHTASDYAKIEPVSAQRWNYFVEARRI